MQRLVALVALAFLSLAATAHAKGIASAEVCGASDCVPLAEHAGYGAIQGSGVSGPGGAEPLVDVNVTFRADAPPGARPATDTLGLRFAPKAGMLRDEEGLWHRPDAPTLAALREASEAVLAPRPAARPVERASALPFAIAGLAALLAAALVAAARRRRPAAST